MNGRNFSQKLALIIFLSFFLFIAESVIKYYFINKIPDRGFYFFGGVLQLVFSPNQNLAFGLPLPQILIIVLAVIILIVLCYLWWLTLLKGKMIQLLAVSLIIMGALSNLLDRLLFGYVIDYINIFFWPAKDLAWPIFNLADAMIVIGVGIYIISEFKRTKNII